MTTPNTPTPPPGYRLLTPEEYGKPLPEGTMFLGYNGTEWRSSTMVGQIAYAAQFYAIPITHPATGDAKPVEQRQELPRYFVIAHDAEGNYETMECNDPVEGWFRLMWDNPTDVPADEVEAFKEFARNTDNWRLHSGQPTHLKWELEDGAIEFYLITHK